MTTLFEASMARAKAWQDQAAANQAFRDFALLWLGGHLDDGETRAILTQLMEDCVAADQATAAAQHDFRTLGVPPPLTNR